MTRPRLSILILALVLPAVTAGLAAQTADEVINKYLQASGGREALSKIQNRVVKGTFAMPDMGMYAPMEIYIQPPDKVYTYIEIAGMGSASNGVNGQVAWEINPMVGARVIQGPDRADALLQAKIEPMLEWNKYYRTIELAGTETVNGKPCYKLVMTPLEGSVATSYFDQESGLVVRIDSTRDGQPVSTTLADYRPVDGLMLAHKMAMSTPQFAFEMTFDSVQHNVEIPAGKFDLPAEIQSQVQ